MTSHLLDLVPPPALLGHVVMLQERKLQGDAVLIAALLLLAVAAMPGWLVGQESHAGL